MKQSKSQRIKLFIVLGVEFLIIIAMLLMIFFAGKKVYTVTFELNGGTLLSGDTVQRVTQGQNATPPTVTKDGCYFLKWSVSYREVTKDLVVEAVWEYETSYGIEYTADKEGEESNYCEISGSYEHIGGSLYIGAYHNEKKVLGIQEGAFQNRSRITSVYLLDGILAIEDYAFAGCTNLEIIVLPSTLVSLGVGVFENCVNLKTVVVTETLDGMLSEEVLEYVKQEVVVLPNGLERVGENAFYGCDKIKEVFIPESVRFMGNTVFNKNVAVEEERLLINLYAAEKPDGWANDWYVGNPTLVWGYSLDEDVLSEDTERKK